MKVLILGLCALALLGACNKGITSDSDRKMTTTGGEIKKVPKSAATPEETTVQFYSWYLREQRKAPFFIALDTDTKPHWEYYADLYLKKLASSPFLADAYTDSLRRKVKSCNEAYRRQHPDRSQPCGFQFDAVTGEYDPVTIDTVKVAHSEINGREARVQLGKYRRYGKEAGNILVKLRTHRDRWLITSIMPDTSAASMLPGAASAHASLKDRLLGKHKLALQWISWTHFGEVTFYEKDEVIYVEGKQTQPGSTDFLSLQGVVDIIDEKQFRFSGTIITQVSHINGGKPCERKGTFTFAARGHRKYWRLQQMTNPCDPVVDYVDVYF